MPIGYKGDHNKALGLSLLISLAFHIVFLFFLGSRIQQHQYESRIEVDIKLLAPDKNERNTPRPRRPPLKTVLQIPNLKRHLASRMDYFSSIPEKIPKQAKDYSQVSYEKVACKPDPVPTCVVATPVHSIMNETGLPASIESTAFNIDQTNAYLAMIYSCLEKLKKYPLSAKRQGIEGRVGLAFLLHRDGTPGDIKITKSSHFPVLDKAAIETVKAGNPYPPFPEGIKEDSIWIDVPIIFDLMEESIHD